MITVVAALIVDNGRLLICQRRRDDRFGLKWEFPGGKAQPGETPAAALARELTEELGVAATVGREVYRVNYRYAELADDLELIFFSAMLPAAPNTPPWSEPRRPLRNLAFERIEWVAPDALPRYDFLPADLELVTLLSTGSLRVP